MNNSILSDLPDQPDPWSGGDSWKPGDGEAIVGEVTRRTTERSERYGTEFEVLTLENDEGGEIDVVSARAHLAALVKEHDPHVGDTVAIRHWNPEPGERAHRYAMRVQKGDDDAPF
jgi:hypothetical protein